MHRTSRSPKALVLPISLAMLALVVASGPDARGDDARFVRDRRGVVDLESRLTWRIGEPRFLAWGDASEHCERLDGGVGWRLPTLRELEAMILPVERRTRVSALMPQVFGRAIGAAYWSSDARSRRDPARRLALDEDGTIDAVPTATPLAVRCVRAGGR